MAERYFTGALANTGVLVGTESIPLDLPGGGSALTTPADLKTYIGNSSADQTTVLTTASVSPFVVPVGATGLDVELWGGGGGGSGDASANVGADGTKSIFDGIEAAGGRGGQSPQAVPLTGAGVATLRQSGSAGAYGNSALLATFTGIGGAGASGPFGGAGAFGNGGGVAGGDGVDGTGAGGGGGGHDASATHGVGPGGCSAEYVRFSIPGPLAVNYAFTVGLGGLGGAASAAAGGAGGKGGAGSIVVTAKF